MAVGVPVPLAKVDLHIAADKANPLHIKQGVPEVGTGRGPRTAGIQHPDARTGTGTEVGLPGGTPLPELPQQPFRYLAALVFAGFADTAKCRCYRPAVGVS